VDDFTLGVLFVAERDDRGFAPTRVGAEFRVDVSLDNLGDGLGLVYVERREEKRVSYFYFILWRRERSQEEKNQRKSFCVSQNRFFLFSLSPLDRRGDVPMRGSDRHQSAEIKNNRALIRVLSSFLRGSVIVHVFNSHQNISRANWRKKDTEKRKNFRMLRIGYARARFLARILGSIERTKNNEIKKNNGQLMMYLLGPWWP
jgi:hypothetical protein